MANSNSKTENKPNAKAPRSNRPARSFQYGTLGQQDVFKRVLRTANELKIAEQVVGDIDRSTSGTSRKAVRRMRGYQGYVVSTINGAINMSESGAAYPILWGTVLAGPSGYPVHAGTTGLEMPFVATTPGNGNGISDARKRTNDSFREALVDMINEGKVSDISHITTWLGTLQPRKIAGESVDLLVVSGREFGSLRYIDMAFDGPADEPMAEEEEMEDSQDLEEAAV